MACEDKGCLYWCVGAEWIAWEIHCEVGCDCSEPTLPCSPTENFNAKVSFPCVASGPPPDPEPGTCDGQSAWQCLGGEWSLVDDACGGCFPTEPTVDCVEGTLAAGGCNENELENDTSASSASTDCSGACPEDDWRHTAELAADEMAAPDDGCGGLCRVPGYTEGIAENFSLIVPELGLAAYADLTGTWDLAYIGPDGGITWITTAEGAYWRLLYDDGSDAWTLSGHTAAGESVDFALDGEFDPCGSSLFDYSSHTGGGTWSSPLALGVAADGPCNCCSDDSDDPDDEDDDDDDDDDTDGPSGSNGVGIFASLSKAACIELHIFPGTGRCSNLGEKVIKGSYSSDDDLWVGEETYGTPLGSGTWYFDPTKPPTLSLSFPGDSGGVTINFEFAGDSGGCLNFFSTDPRICKAPPGGPCVSNTVYVRVCCVSCGPYPRCSSFSICSTVPECFQLSPSFPECFVVGVAGTLLPGYIPGETVAGLLIAPGCYSSAPTLVIPCDPETNRLGSVASFHPGYTEAGALLPPDAYGDVQVISEFPLHLRVYADLSYLADPLSPIAWCDAETLSNVVYDIRVAIPQVEPFGDHPSFLNRYCQPPERVTECEQQSDGAPEAWLLDLFQFDNQDIEYCLGNFLRQADVLQYRHESGCTWRAYQLQWHHTTEGYQYPIDPPSILEITDDEIIVTFNVDGPGGLFGIPLVYSGPKGSGCEPVTLTLTSVPDIYCEFFAPDLPTEITIAPYGECNEPDEGDGELYCISLTGLHHQTGAPFDCDSGNSYPTAGGIWPFPGGPGAWPQAVACGDVGLPTEWCCYFDYEVISGPFATQEEAEAACS